LPTLNWIGKEKVITHHQDVPFRVLQHIYGFSADSGKTETAVESGNKIIHGDNLEALKSLLPLYEGKVDCIYIDPPYNTGNENWVYNDNVNHPKIRKWMSQFVGKEGDDLCRHDKWLCMMYPRLKLLHKLLAYSGAIFISIDDAEFANLKLICNEIFGSANFLGSFCWKRRTSSALADKYLSIDHEYILCFQKGGFSSFKGVEKNYRGYKNPNNDPKGGWMLDNLTVGMDKSMRPNQYYDLVDPITKKVFPANPNRVWAYIPESMNKLIEKGRIFFPGDSKKKPMLKRYKSDLKETHNPISSILTNSSDQGNKEHNVGLNSAATKELQEIFGEKIFDYPKPKDLIRFFIDQTTSSKSIILDSFAGSGTTGHAVIEQNTKDGGERKFILIEMEDYADSITAERIQRVICRTKGDIAGNLSFDYYGLGSAIFRGENNEVLNEEIPLKNIRDYIWYSETKIPLPKLEITGANPYLLGVNDHVSYYFFYESNQRTALDYDFLSTINLETEQYVVYADTCLLAKDYLSTHNIIFKKIPRDITRF
jgi:adenine-specific DNA-methyltransferase